MKNVIDILWKSSKNLADIVVKAEASEINRIKPSSQNLSLCYLYETKKKIIDNEEISNMIINYVLMLYMNRSLHMFNHGIYFLKRNTCPLAFLIIISTEQSLFKILLTYLSIVLCAWTPCSKHAWISSRTHKQYHSP